MPQDSEQLVVAIAGSVKLANLADAPDLPADDDGPTDDTPDFTDLGYTTTEGVTFTATPTTEDIDAWQSATPIRRLVTARALAIAFQLQQWNQDNFSLAFGGGEWSEPAPGVFRYDPPADTDALSEYALIVDFADGDKNARVVTFRGNVTDAVETQLMRTGPSVLPITFQALTPDDKDRSWYFVGDDPLSFGDFS